MNKNNVNKSKKRSTIRQALRVGTYPCKLLSKFAFPIYVMASNLTGIKSAASKSYRKGNTLYSYD